jgi:prophage tail gpP-like protein
MMMQPFARPPAPEPVLLTVDGREFAGWKQVQVSGSLNSPVTNFTLKLSEHWVEGGRPPRIITVPIKVGSAVALEIGRERVLTGYIERVSRSIDGSAHEVSVAGRSKSADLVDCCVEAGVNLRNVSLRYCIETLLKPFDITLTVSPSAKSGVETTIANFHAKSGEPVLEEIKRLCALHALLVSDGPWGDLVLAGAGAHGDAITLDARRDAVLGGSVSLDHAGLYSPVDIFGRGGRATAVGSDTIALVKGRATNDQITRYRPMMSQASADERSGSAESQARLIIANQKARSVSADLRLAGWRRPDGKLWWKGQMIRLADPHLGYEGDLVVQRFDLSLSESGSIVSLSLAPAEPVDPDSASPVDEMGDLQPG